MSIPTYDELMLPLLQLAAQSPQEQPIRNLREQLAQQLNLTPEQRAIKLPSGRQATFDNRVGWASTYLRKAGLLESTRRGYVKTTPRGRDVLNQRPTAIDNAYLQQFEDFRDFSDRASGSEGFHRASGSEGFHRASGSEGFHRASGDDSTLRTTPAKIAEALTPSPQPDERTTPDERIRQAYAILEADLRDNLLDKIKQMDPTGFEGLVLQLLHAMGYGGSLKDVEGVPVGPDGGIDGLIKEDKLGLDTIYIQAKRWGDKSVGREKIQAFAGAIAGVGARKGVFMTTSTFTPQAHSYVNGLQGSKIVLVDGQTLAQLMIEHNVGVSIRETFDIKRIDEDFFSEVDV